MQIVELEKLAISQEALTAGYRASMILQEAGLMRYPGPQWDDPALVLLDGKRCVGGIQWKTDNIDKTVSVPWAWASPDVPGALARLLIALRAKFKGTEFVAVEFVAHHANAPMMKLVERMKLVPLTSRYSVPLQPGAQDV